MIQLLGNSFGQYGSTLKCGSGTWASASWQNPETTKHIKTETVAIKIDLLVFRFSMEAFSNLTELTELELKQDLPF